TVSGRSVRVAWCGFTTPKMTPFPRRYAIVGKMGKGGTPRYIRPRPASAPCERGRGPGTGGPSIGGHRRRRDRRGRAPRGGGRRVGGGGGVMRGVGVVPGGGGGTQVFSPAPGLSGPADSESPVRIVTAGDDMARTILGLSRELKITLLALGETPRSGTARTVL